MLTEHILFQLVVILIVVQLVGQLCRLLGQQWVIGEILAGLALGPSLLGGLWPGLSAQLFPANTLPALTTLGDIGLILYMFSVGAHLDLNRMWQQSRLAGVVTISGSALPLVVGLALAVTLYPGFAGANATALSFALLVGTALAVTAFPVLARLLDEKKLLHTPIGVLAMTCAALNDVLAWCLLALVTALIHAAGPFAAAIPIGLTVLFAGAMLGVVRPLLALADRHLRAEAHVALFTAVLWLAAYATSAIGVHPVFGAFVMGLILPRTPIALAYIRSIEHVNNILLLPLFFVVSGLHTRIGLLDTPQLMTLCALILVLACLGKIAGTALPMRGFGRSWREALALGALMNTRGSVGLIVLNIGLDEGILSPRLFAILIVMVVITTIMASPLLPLLGYGRAYQSAVSTEDSTQQATASRPTGEGEAVSTSRH